MSLQAILKDMQKMHAMQHSQNVQHYYLHEEKSIIYATPNDRVYIPSPTAELFHDDNTFVRLVMGPYGSGKSTMCCQEIVRRACQMPAWYKGRRKSKWVIIRNTSGQLETTTLPTWLSWFEELGTVKKRKKPVLMLEHTFNDGKGIVELDVMFLALDREADISKVKSLEATGVFLNELSEIPEFALTHLKARINGRYPSTDFCRDPYWSGIICDTNPPDEDHWIYRDFESKPINSHKIFHQPPGLLKDKNGNWYPNELADNYKHLNNSYYTNFADGKSEQFIKVYCLGEYGSVGYGKSVYPEYNDDLHSVPHIEAIQGDPIHLGWDFGLTPRCIVVQFSSRGQLRILKEYKADDIGIRSFATSIVLPGLKRDFPYCKIGTSKADPSGIQRDTIMEELSCIGELNNLGIATEGAHTNAIATRLGGVKFFLTTMSDGHPCFLLDRSGCPDLRKGMIKEYVYDRVSIRGEERYKDVPFKNEASHSQDALQYIALEFASNVISQQKVSSTPVDIYNPGFRMG